MSDAKTPFERYNAKPVVKDVSRYSYEKYIYIQYGNRTCLSLPIQHSISNFFR